MRTELRKLPEEQQKQIKKLALATGKLWLLHEQTKPQIRDYVK